MKSPQPVLETGEQSEGRDFLVLLATRAEHWLGGFKVDVTEFVEPEVVESIGRLAEAKSIEIIVDILDGLVELAEDPAV